MNNSEKNKGDEYNSIDAADGGDRYYECSRCRGNLVESEGLICSECKADERLDELYPPIDYE